MTRNRVLEQLNPLERFISQIIEEEFEELAKACKDRFIDSEGLVNCSYHESNIGVCRAELCPRLKGSSNSEQKSEIKREYGVTLKHKKGRTRLCNSALELPRATYGGDLRKFNLQGGGSGEVAKKVRPTTRTP